MTAALKPRHPVVALLWALAIFIGINVPQFLGIKVGSLLAGLPFRSVMDGSAHNVWSYLGQGLVAAFISIPIGYFLIPYLWRRSAAWMRLRFNGRLAMAGLLLGLILPPAVLAIISGIGEVAVIGTPSRLTASEITAILMSTLCWTSFIAFTEETVFRGMIVREWAVQWGWGLATLFGGLVFGVVHLPGVEGGLSWFSATWTLLAALAMSVLLVALYVRSKSLWLPIGVHAGWNLSLQGILGVTISGKESHHSLFQMRVSGQDWLTGGAFGVEASTLAIVVYILVATIVLRFGRDGDSPLLDPNLTDTGNQESLLLPRES